jgi:REP element-mobilizing transposase RayT
VLAGDVDRRLRELLAEKADELEVTIHALEVMPDHVHLFVEADPTLCAAEVVNHFKGFTSRFLRKEFATLRSRLPCLWSRSYYAGTVGAVSESVIRRYIDSQKGKQVRRAFKYRLFTNANQERELAAMLETHRRLYNACLAERKERYEADKVTVRYAQQSARFKAERVTNPYYARLNFSSAQATMRRLDKAYQAFFRRVKNGERPGFPRFKSPDRYDSVEFPAYGDGIKLMPDGKLRVQHVGTVRVKLHRGVEGRIKTAPAWP